MLIDREQRPTDAEGALDAALERLHATAPEYAGGLSNHGPMVAECLVARGAGQRVAGWIAGYLPQLEPLAKWRREQGDPPQASPVLASAASHRAWCERFEGELSVRDWRQVLADWLPRLAPGLASGATHGLIRTAHAALALERSGSAARITELGCGLAYWASVYRELPAGEGTIDRDPVEAIEEIPLLDRDLRSDSDLIVERLAQVALSDDFVGAAGRVDCTGADFWKGILSLTARLYLQQVDQSPYAFAHGITAALAVQRLENLLGGMAAGELRPHLWRLLAALVSSMSSLEEPCPIAAHVLPDESWRKETWNAAIAGGAPHAVKLVDACLEMATFTGDPSFGAVARDAVRRLQH